MPHITKYIEKIQCIKPKLSFAYYDNGSWQTTENVEYKQPITVRSTSSNQYVCYNRALLFDIIEKTVDETLPKVIDKNFEQFVDIKEVPYGRYNSDSDYWGS